MIEAKTLRAEPLSEAAFAPFGRVIEAVGEPDFTINAGRCGRFHNRATPLLEDRSEGAELALSVALSKAAPIPLLLDLMERHPLGTQAFVPMEGTRFLVTVAADDGGRPGRPRAFVTDGGQGIQYDANCWHGVLAPLTGPSRFLIVDRVGPGENLEEFSFETPYRVVID